MSLGTHLKKHPCELMPWKPLGLSSQRLRSRQSNTRYCDNGNLTTIRGASAWKSYVSGNATEDHLVDLIRTLSTGHDPVLIKAYGSDEAYQAEQNETYGDVWETGYLLFYVKNFTGRGAFSGFNEIRWMQQEGNLPHKLGEKTVF